MRHNEQIGAPPGNRVLVECPAKQEKTAGGIYVPDTARDREQRGVTRGRLIDAGLLARDKLVSAGWRFGDMLTWTVFAPVYVKWDDAQGGSHEALALDYEDIVTNVDLATRLNAGEQQIVRTVVDGKPYHMITERNPTPTAGVVAPANGDSHAQGQRTRSDG